MTAVSCSRITWTSPFILMLTGCLSLNVRPTARVLKCTVFMGRSHLSHVGVESVCASHRRGRKRYVLISKKNSVWWCTCAVTSRQWNPSERWWKSQQWCNIHNEGHCEAAMNKKCVQNVFTFIFFIYSAAVHIVAPNHANSIFYSGAQRAAASETKSIWQRTQTQPRRKMRCRLSRAKHHYVSSFTLWQGK